MSSKGWHRFNCICLPKIKNPAIKHLHLRGFSRWNSWIWYLVLPFVSMGIMLAALALGFTRTVWPLKRQSINGIEIDQDLQVIFIGGVNKMLDVFVQGVLEHMALIFSTLWMIQPNVGATIRDIALKDDMVKPWRPFLYIWNSSSDVNPRSCLRFVTTLAISVCVFLLGPCLTTVGWPKHRWYPDVAESKWVPSDNPAKSLAINFPLLSLERVDWANDMRLGLGLVGGDPKLDEQGLPLMTGGAADEIAGTLSAADAFYSLTRLPGMFSQQSPGWASLWETGGALTGMNKTVDGSTIQSVSIQAIHIKDTFNKQRLNTSSYIKFSTGFHALIRQTAPLLTTTCYPPGSDEQPDNSLEILAPESNDSATFVVNVGSSAGLAFLGVSCKLTVSQVLFQVDSWIINEADPTFVIHNLNTPPLPLPVETTQSNALIASRLAKHFKSIIPMLHGQVPSFGVVPHLAMIARMLRAQHANFTSEHAAIASIVGALSQNQLSRAAWTMSIHEDTIISSGPVRWQVYGSGARLQWEWVASVVLFVMATVMGSQFVLLCVYRIKPGTWLDLGGMLRVAHQTAQEASLSLVVDARNHSSDNQVLLHVEALSGRNGELYTILKESSGSDNLARPGQGGVNDTGNGIPLVAQLPVTTPDADPRASASAPSSSASETEVSSSSPVPEAGTGLGVPSNPSVLGTTTPSPAPTLNPSPAISTTCLVPSTQPPQ